MRRLCVFACLWLAGCSAAADPAKPNFARAETREHPVIPEEEAALEYLKKLNGLGDHPSLKLVVEKWGPHLFGVAMHPAHDEYDVTVFTMEDDQRKTGAYIRAKYKVVSPPTGQTFEGDVVLLVPGDGSDVMGCLRVPGTDDWPRPYLDYQQRSNKKRRQLSR